MSDVKLTGERAQQAVKCMEAAKVVAPGMHQETAEVNSYTNYSDAHKHPGVTIDSKESAGKDAIRLAEIVSGPRGSIIDNVANTSRVFTSHALSAATSCINKFKP